MVWAVIKFLGKQYLVKVGSKIQVENIPDNLGNTITFGEILLVANSKVSLGKPKLPKVKVTGKVIRKFLGPKLMVTKFKPKSRYFRKRGARQKLAEIEISKIE